MTESDAGFAAVDKGTARNPVDEETQSEQEPVRPRDDDPPVVGVTADAEPDADLLPGHRPRKLAGPRSDEQDAELSRDEDVGEG